MCIGLTALALAGCSTVPSLPEVSIPDSYALSPPPELTTPQDEPLIALEPVSATQAATAPIIHDDLWQHLSKGFTLPRDRVRVRDTARRLVAGRRHLDETLRRAEPFLWHLVAEVEARKLPLEIALLPAIESAYNPYAYSPQQALGLWQFLPRTGDRFGLRRNWWYDGRRDVTESTRAALEYLDYLHGMFDDWLLALAAYNSGEGRVQQALASNRARGLPGDFWSLPLPAETRDYVPKVLGLAELLAQPDVYGYELQPLAGGPRFEMVELPGQVELALAADLIDVDEKSLQKLNAGYTRWATDPQGPHRLLVPYGSGEALREKLEDLANTDLVRWHVYEVAEGDNLESIARRYGVNVALLRETNDLSGNRIRAGQALRVPRATGSEVHVAQSEPSRERQTVRHVIRSGDSLSRIAAQHGVRVSDLTRWNDVSASTILRPGRTLVIHRARKGVRTAGI